MILKGFTISGLPPPLLFLRNLLLHIASLLKVKTTHTNKPFDIYFVYCILSESICAYMEAERRRLESPPVAAVAAVAAGGFAI